MVYYRQVMLYENQISQIKWDFFQAVAGPIQLYECAIWEFHKNATWCFEQILEATPHKTAATRPLTSHLKNHSSKTNKTCRILLEKQGWTYKRRSSMNPYIGTRQCWPTSKNLHQLTANSKCSLQNLLEAMEDRNIHASSTTWWGWW